MPKASPLLYNFNSGEWSETTYGRVDMEKYRNSVSLCRNFIPLVQGPVMRRPGTVFAAAVKNSAHTTVLLPFQYSTTKSYVIEAGDQYFRYYTDRTQLKSGGNPVETVTPYAHTDLRTLNYAQSADVLYLAHGSYAPRTLTRTTTTSFTLAEFAPTWGPFLEENVSATTITASAVTGAGITLTASDPIFAAGHVGSAWLFRTVLGSALSKWTAGTAYGAGAKVYYLNRRYSTVAGGTAGNNPPIHDSGTASDGAVSWVYEGIDRGYAKITGFTSTTVVTATVVERLPDDALAGTKRWSEGAWSAVRGYPKTVTFYEDRLWFGGTPTRPQTVWSSRSGDYNNYLDIDPATGDVNADGALVLTLNSAEVNAIRWLSDEERALLIGTAGGPWVLRPAAPNEPLSPTNVSAKRSTKIASADLAAVRAERTTLFVQAGGEKVRELSYVFDIDGFRAPDMTILADHICKGGLVQIAMQYAPFQILWGVRVDGVLVGMTYEREQDVVGWHQHTLGGDGLVQSVVCVSEPNGVYDDPWLIVQREVNGSTVQWVEYITDMRPGSVEYLASHYVDAGVFYNGAATATVTGLAHLNGETVSVLADGATHPDVVVSGGQVVLTRTGSKIHVGYPYNSDLQTMRIEAGAADGTAQGKTKRIHKLVLRVMRTLGLQVGPSADKLKRLAIRRSTDAMGAAVPLFSGDIEVEFNGDYDKEGQIYLRADQPLPATIMALMPQLHTQDR